MKIKRDFFGLWRLLLLMAFLSTGFGARADRHLQLNLQPLCHHYLSLLTEPEWNPLRFEDVIVTNLHREGFGDAEIAEKLNLLTGASNPSETNFRTQDMVASRAEKLGLNKQNHRPDLVSRSLLNDPAELEKNVRRMSLNLQVMRRLQFFIAKYGTMPSYTYRGTKREIDLVLGTTYVRFFGEGVYLKAGDKYRSKLNESRIEALQKCFFDVDSNDSLNSKEKSVVKKVLLLVLKKAKFKKLGLLEKQRTFVNQNLHKFILRKGRMPSEDMIDGNSEMGFVLGIGVKRFYGLDGRGENSDGENKQVNASRLSALRKAYASVEGNASLSLDDKAKVKSVLWTEIKMRRLKTLTLDQQRSVVNRNLHEFIAKHGRMPIQKNHRYKKDGSTKDEYQVALGCIYQKYFGQGPYSDIGVSKRSRLNGSRREAIQNALDEVDKNPSLTVSQKITVRSVLQADLKNIKYEKTKSPQTQN